MIGGNKSRDLFYPITVAALEKQMKIEPQDERLYLPLTKCRNFVCLAMISKRNETHPMFLSRPKLLGHPETCSQPVDKILFSYHNLLSWAYAISVACTAYFPWESSFTILRNELPLIGQYWPSFWAVLSGQLSYLFNIVFRSYRKGMLTYKFNIVFRSYRKGILTSSFNIVFRSYRLNGSKQKVYRRTMVGRQKCTGRQICE